MEDAENENMQQYIQNIEMQHKQKTITTKQAVSTLITILQQKPEMSRYVNLAHYKSTGFTTCLHLFLQLVNLCTENATFLCDMHVLCFLSRIVAKFCNKNKQDDANSSTQESTASDDTNDAQTVYKMFDTRDAKQNNTLIAYIDDEVVAEIFDIITNVFDKGDNVFLLSLMHKIGFFDLFFVVNAEQTCKLLDAIYKNKTYSNKTKKDKNATNDKKENNMVVEVKRRMFDSQIMTKCKEHVDNKVYISQKQATQEAMYAQIMQEFVSKSFGQFVEENDIAHLLHILTYAMSLYTDNTKNEQKQNFFDIVYTDITINKMKKYIAKKAIEPCIDLYILLLSNAATQKQHKTIIAKLVCDYEVNKKLYKILETTNKEAKKNVFVIFGYFARLTDLYNKNSTEQISIQNMIDVLQKESNVKSLFDTLNYEFDEKQIVVDLLKKLYTECKKEHFYKISYLVIIRHVVLDYDKNFANAYFADITKYLSADKSNFVKLLFCKQQEKQRSKKADDAQDVGKEDNTDEQSDDSSVIFSKRINIE